MPISDRLQALLDRACAANKAERDCLSHVGFLVELQKEARDFDEELLKQTQLAICTSFLEILNSATSKQDASSTSRTTETYTSTDSHAVQTDAATISLWDILPKARDEAYNRGVNDGKDQGRMQRIKYGKDLGMDEGLVVRFNQGLTEGFVRGLAQRDDFEIARSLEMNKKAEPFDEPTEGLKKERENVQKMSRNFSSNALKRGAIRKNNVLSLAQGMPKSEHRKENTKVAVLGNDPFASIWQEERKKRTK